MAVFGQCRSFMAFVVCGRLDKKSNAATSAAADQDDVDLDELLQEHKQQYADDEPGEYAGVRGGHHGRKLAQVFTIDPKTLNVELELRKQFGGEHSSMHRISCPCWLV